jgi:hypothetical protein
MGHETPIIDIIAVDGVLQSLDPLLRDLPDPWLGIRIRPDLALCLEL